MTTLGPVYTAPQLGVLLREARLAAGLTQAALAERAGVGRQWLVAFENAEKDSAPLDMVLRVVGALGVQVTLAGLAR